MSQQILIQLQLAKRHRAHSHVAETHGCDMKGCESPDGSFLGTNVPSREEAHGCIQVRNGVRCKGIAQQMYFRKTPAGRLAFCFAVPVGLSHRFALPLERVNCRDGRRSLFARIKVLQRTDQSMFEAQAHRDLVRLATQARFARGKNPVDELRGIAIGARPCGDGQATYLKVAAYIICATH